MAPDEYFWTRTGPQAEDFADRLNTSRVTLRNHYFPRDAEGIARAKAVPSLKRMRALAAASEGLVSLSEVVAYFTEALDRDAA